MSERKVANARGLPDLHDINLVPATAVLRPRPAGERRNVAAREALLRRIRDEFEEMPGLSLTLVQAARLFALTPEACSRILLRLVDERQLCVKSDGRYGLPMSW